MSRKKQSPADKGVLLFYSYRIRVLVRGLKIAGKYNCNCQTFCSEHRTLSVRKRTPGIIQPKHNSLISNHLQFWHRLGSIIGTMRKIERRKESMKESNKIKMMNHDRRMFPLNRNHNSSFIIYHPSLLSRFLYLTLLIQYLSLFDLVRVDQSDTSANCNESEPESWIVGV